MSNTDYLLNQFWDLKDRTKVKNIIDQSEGNLYCQYYVNAPVSEIHLVTDIMDELGCPYTIVEKDYNTSYYSWNEFVLYENCTVAFVYSMESDDVYNEIEGPMKLALRAKGIDALYWNNYPIERGDDHE